MVLEHFYNLFCFVRIIMIKLEILIINRWNGIKGRID